jgi:hypothetical protein
VPGALRCQDSVAKPFSSGNQPFKSDFCIVSHSASYRPPSQVAGTPGERLSITTWDGQIALLNRFRDGTSSQFRSERAFQ